MNMKQKWVACCLLVVMLITTICGCSSDVTMTINENGSGTMTQTVMIETAYLESGEIVLNPEYTYEDVTVGGVPYKKTEITTTFNSVSELSKMEGMEDCLFTFNEKQFSMKGKSAAYAGTSSSAEMEQMKELMQISYTITFPYEIKDTNGKIQSDKKTVVWDGDILYAGEACWAVFSDELLDSSIAAPKISGVKSGTYYKKNVTVKATSDTLITSLKVNGVSVDADTCQITKEGKYTVTCTGANGKTTKVSFVIDKTRPKVSGVANGKTYKAAKTIKYSDKYGVKKATLNGKKISSGKKVSKKGSYKLVVTDKAGNQTVVKFKIK